MAKKEEELRRRRKKVSARSPSKAKKRPAPKKRRASPPTSRKSKAPKKVAKKAAPKKVAKKAPKKVAKKVAKKAAPKKVVKKAPKKVVKKAPKKVAKKAPKKVAKKVAKKAPKKVAKKAAPKRTRAKAPPRKAKEKAPRKRSGVASSAAKKKPTQKKPEAWPPRKKVRKVLQKPHAGEYKAAKAKELLEQLGKRPRRSKVKGTIWKVSDLLDAAKAESLQEEKEIKRRAKKVEEWQRDRNRPRPSRHFVQFFDENGTWQKNDDGTWTGWVHLPAPASAEQRLHFMRDWFFRWQNSLMWLDDEPVWIAVGLQLSGVEAAIRDRYARIEGKLGIVSGWVMSRALCRSMGIECKGFASLSLDFWEEVIPNLYEKGMRIVQVSVFTHYGPSRPVGDIMG